MMIRERTFQIVGRTSGNTLKWSKLRILEAHPEANAKSKGEGMGR